MSQTWPISDPLGSVAAQVNSANVATQINRYDEYGRIQAFNGPFGYAGAVSAVRLFIDTMTSELEARPDATASESEWADLLTVIEDRLKFAEALVRGTPMTRPEWPGEGSGIDPGSE